MKVSEKSKWINGNLSDIADITMGQSPPGNSYNDLKNGIGLINGPTEFTNKYPVVKQWTSKPTKLCKAGDILLCVRGSSTGRMNIADDEYCIGRGVASIRAKKDKAETSFIYYTLNYKVNQLLQKTAGSTFPNLGSNEIKNMIVGIPLFTEQQKIASILSIWDKAIELKEKLIEQKKEQKKGLMQKLLTGEVRLPGFDGEWKNGTIKDLGLLKGGSGFPERYQNEVSGEYPFFKVSDMNKLENDKYMMSANNYISQIIRKEIKATIIPKESIIFAKVGAALLLERKRILTNDSCIDNNMMALTTYDNIDNIFVYYLLLNTKLSKVSNVGALPSLNAKDIYSIKCKYPADNSEQKAIGKLLTLVDKEIELLEKELLEKKYQKRGLMQQLLTGKIRVKV